MNSTWISRRCLVGLALVLPSTALGADTGAPQAKYGDVLFHNKSSVSLRVVCNYYIDANGIKHRSRDGYWTFASGERAYLLTKGERIVARRFSFSVKTPSGTTKSWVTTERAVRGNELVATVTNGDLGTTTRRSEARNRAIGKIVGAFIAEAARRESIDSNSLIGQILGTAIRNGLVESALEDAFPNANSSQRGLMTRYVTMVMEGDLSARSFATETAREALVQALRRKDPDFGAAASFTDFLYDLYQQRENRR